MHVQVNTCADHKTLFCSFVYADNYHIDRRELWSNLVGHAGLMRNRPWVLLGDFNAALILEDHSAGGYEPNAAMCEFKECVQTMEVFCYFPAFAIFQPYCISDHSTCVLPIDRDPSSSMLREENAHYLLAFKEAQLDEERFLKQKAKIDWLKAGDSNTTYFHKIVKIKCAKNMIEMFLKAKGVTIPLDDHDLFTRALDDAKADFMVRDVSNDE
ncbi:sodium/hydrogen exchanger 6, partial [Tanacetum coccineum]